MIKAYLSTGEVVLGFLSMAQAPEYVLFGGAVWKKSDIQAGENDALDIELSWPLSPLLYIRVSAGSPHLVDYVSLNRATDYEKATAYFLQTQLDEQRERLTSKPPDIPEASDVPVPVPVNPQKFVDKGTWRR